MGKLNRGNTTGNNNTNNIGSTNTADVSKPYTTQYLKSWTANAYREQYLIDQSTLDRSYSLHDEDEEDDEDHVSRTNSPAFGGSAQGSWIDLSGNSSIGPNRNQTEEEEEGETTEEMIDNSLTTILAGYSKNENNSGRRTSNATSVTMVADSSKDSNSSQKVERSTILEAVSPSTTSASASISLSENFEDNSARSRGYQANKKNHGGQNDPPHNVKMTNILFQIFCLSVIIASFSFSLGFLFGIKNSFNHSSRRHITSMIF